MKRLWYFIQKLDIALLIVTLLISLFGLAALYSIGLSKEVPDFTLFKKQLVFVFVGIASMLIIASIDYRTWRQYAKLIFVLALALLVGVLLFGTTIRGATGWFVFGNYQFQPIEIVKILLVITLSFYFSSCNRPLNSLGNVVKSFLLMAILFLLTLLQPDLGSAMLLAILWFGYIIVIGLKRWQVVVFSLLGGVFFVLGWLFVLKDYQKDRILVFLNAGQDVLGKGYAVAQSVIAIGSGRLMGRGLGFGSQSQLKFLPESHADFIFSVIAEELGFVGVSILLLLFVLFLLRIIRIAKNAKDDFALFMSLGAFLLFFSQTVLNIGVTLGILPVTGVTLPLVSYGGSSLIGSFMLLAILQSIHIRSIS